jgi:hypothetical protein
MGKDYLSMVKEGLMIFMCASLGIYFAFATFFSVKNELNKETVSVDMYHLNTDEGIATVD